MSSGTLCARCRPEPFRIRELCARCRPEPLRIRELSAPAVGQSPSRHNELIEDYEQLKKFNRLKVDSQVGELVALPSEDHREKTDDVAIFLVDRKSKAGGRVVIGALAAETQAALAGSGMTYFAVALLCEVLFGRLPVKSYGEQHMKVVVWTDCGSRYDHMQDEGIIPEHRHTAVGLAEAMWDILVKGMTRLRAVSAQQTSWTWETGKSS